MLKGTMTAEDTYTTLLLCFIIISIRSHHYGKRIHFILLKKMECACYTMEISFSASQELGGNSLSENFLEFFCCCWSRLSR